MSFSREATGWAINRSGRGWNPAVLVFNSLLVFHGAMTPKTALDSDFEVITLIMAAKTAATLYRKLRSNTVRPLTMKKKMLIFLFAAVIGVVAFVLARRAAVSKSVTVTFLLYTNCDAQGGNAFYTWAWFRIENRSPFTVGCYQGMLDVQRAGKWFQDTNNVGRHYFYSHTRNRESRPQSRGWCQKTQPAGAVPSCLRGKTLNT